MEALIHLDTHVVVWLYSGRLDLFPVRARRHLDENELAISPVISLEIDFLREIGRVTESGSAMVEDLVRRLGLRLADTPFERIVSHASSQSWTRDPFDRILVGHAAAEDARLLTKDRVVRRNYANAIWGS